MIVQYRNYRIKRNAKQTTKRFEILLIWEKWECQILKNSMWGNFTSRIPQESVPTPPALLIYWMNMFADEKFCANGWWNSMWKILLKKKKWRIINRSHKEYRLLQNIVQYSWTPEGCRHSKLVVHPTLLPVKI